MSVLNNWCEGDEAYHSSGSDRTVKNEGDMNFMSFNNQTATQFVEDFPSSDSPSTVQSPDCVMMSMGELSMPLADTTNANMMINAETDSSFDPTLRASFFNSDVSATFEAEHAAACLPPPYLFRPPPIQPESSMYSAAGFVYDYPHFGGFPSMNVGRSGKFNLMAPWGDTRHFMDVDVTTSQNCYESFQDSSFDVAARTTGCGGHPSASFFAPFPLPPPPPQIVQHQRQQPNANSCVTTSGTLITPSTVDDELQSAGIVSAKIVPKNHESALLHYQKLLIQKMQDEGADPSVVAMIQEKFGETSGPPEKSSVAPAGSDCAGDLDLGKPKEEELRSEEETSSQKERSESESESSPISQSCSNGGSEQFTCEICQKSYKTEKYLRAHAKVHSETAPACDVCGKRFATPDKVRRHRTIHTGEKPFECEFCQRAFNRKEHLTKHRRVHTGEKPFKCPTCNRGFTQKGNLSSHMKIHTGERPFSCEHCSKNFRLKSHLTTHMRTHTGEKPFSCGHCSKRFSDQSSLSRHRRLHFGNKYKCPECLKEFTDVSNVRRHQRMAHREPKGHVVEDE